MQTVRVFNKTERATVWMDEHHESPQLIPMRWVGGVPAELARKFADREKFAVDWSHKRKGPRRPQPLWTEDGQRHLLLACPVSPDTGYGYLGMKIVEELDKVPNMNLSTSQLLYWASHMPGHIKDILGKHQEICEWALAVAIPSELPNIPAKNILLYTMWETRKLPTSDVPGDNWANMCNNWAKVLIVPCDEQKQLFEDAGVTIPIYTVGIGLDTDVYQPNGATKDELFTIWLHGKLTSRKSPIELLTDVMWGELGEHDDWHLKLKTWGSTLGGGQFFPIINDDRVTVINESMPAEEMANEMSRAHVGVYLSKYEGWGMPAREAMGTGLVTLVSETSGHTPDCNPQYNFPIPISGVADAGDGYPGAWDVPDFEYAKEVIRTLYDEWKAGNWDQVVMGEQASQWIHRRRSWKKMIADILDIIDETHQRVEGQ